MADENNFNILLNSLLSTDNEARTQAEVRIKTLSNNYKVFVINVHP